MQICIQYIPWPLVRWHAQQMTQPNVRPASTSWTLEVTRSALKSVVSHFHHPALKEKMDGIQFPSATRRSSFATQIDGRSVNVKNGSTILQANGIVEFFLTAGAKNHAPRFQVSVVGWALLLMNLFNLQASRDTRWCMLTSIVLQMVWQCVYIQTAREKDDQRLIFIKHLLAIVF